MLVIAHRGANKEALENSWSAFEKAIEAGSARIELDIFLTKDGHYAIHHDRSLHRLTGSHIFINEVNRGDLEKITLKNGEKIPFLDEVLEKILPRVEINIEVKEKTRESGEALAAYLKKVKNLDRIIVSSFHEPPLKFFSDEMRGVHLACLWGDVLDWPNISHYSPLVFMQSVGSSIVHPHTSYVDEEFMDQCKHRGWRVFPYASMNGEDSDREALWSEMMTLGVDGLCTNYPREFKQWVDEVHSNEKRFRF